MLTAATAKIATAKSTVNKMKKIVSSVWGSYYFRITEQVRGAQGKAFISHGIQTTVKICLSISATEAFIRAGRKMVAFGLLI